MKAWIKTIWKNFLFIIEIYIKKQVLFQICNSVCDQGKMAPLNSMRKIFLKMFSSILPLHFCISLLSLLFPTCLPLSPANLSYSYLEWSNYEQIQTWFVHHIIFHPVTPLSQTKCCKSLTAQINYIPYFHQF